MENVWYVLDAGKPTGPFALEELWGRRSAGSINENSLVWKVGMREWQPFKSVVPPFPKLGTSLDDSLQPVSQSQVTQPITSSSGSAVRSSRGGNTTRGVISVLVALVALHITSQITEPSKSRAPLTQSQMEEILQKPNSPFRGFYSTLRTHFPEDYDDLLSKLTSFANSGQSAERLKLQLQEMMARIRRKHAQELLMAPDTNLRQILMSIVQLHEQVLRAEGASKCNEYAQKGPVALDIKRYANELGEQSVQLLTAMAAAKQNPNVRSAATEGDWENVWAKVPNADVYKNVVAQEDYANPEYCRALLTLMDTAARLEGEGGARIRSEMVYSLTSY